ncbi:hypothetical protein Tco_0957137 [Tanacetum coccineum]
MGIYIPYPKEDTFTPLTKTLKEILSMKSVSFPEPPTLIGTPEKQNLNKFCDYHGDRGHNTNDCYQLKKQIEEVVASGKLAHLVKDIRQNSQRNESQGRNNVKVINMVRGGRNWKKPFKGERFGPTDELTFLAIPLNLLMDEPIILEGMIEDHQAEKMQSSANRFLGRNVPPFGDYRPSSNYRRGRKEQNGADGVCDSKMLFAIQRHNKKDRNEKPRGGRRTSRKHRCVHMAGSEETVVPRFVMEHQLNIYPLAELVVHNRRPMTPDGRHALKERMFRWLKEGKIKKVQHSEWVSNAIPVKLANGTWKVQVDFSSLNKVCAKDMYPFFEEGEGLASLMEYLYKCFLRLPKENSQIRMAENDEEKTGFHTGEGVYCFTHMPKGLKISAAILQRMMEKSRGRKVPWTCGDEGRSKSKPRISTDNHSKPHSKRVRMRLDAATGPGWTNEDKEALQKIKMKLNKLQTLAIPKEEEVLMICLRQRKETISSILMVEREGVQAPISYVTVVNNGPMEEILRLSRREGRLAKWVAKIQTYDISYIQREEVEGSVVKKFFGQGKQV